jgi:hypothetical protein
MAPFSGANQYVDVMKSVSVSAPLDWSGMTLHVRVKVSQGTPFRGSVQLYTSTTSAYEFGGTATQVGPSSQWQEYSLNLANPLTRLPGYDPTQVVLFDVQFNTGNAGAGATPVIFNIDTFYLTP